ncbi:MAG: hypothetical protein KF753_11055 [Caldilineaceae bacterium]|nr:hypothetical protein [Caldilineaceae bacterium]
MGEQLEEPVIRLRMPGDHTPEETFDDFWRSAVRACKEIEQFKPEIVIGLAHAGWAPVVATRAVWEEVSDIPFPPTLRTNLGREKLDPYWDSSKDRYHFHGTYSSPKEVADFLLWLDSQLDLQEQLARQIVATLGNSSPPNRILVLDEMIAQGNTWLLVLGLLDRLYPDADVRFLDGPYFDWRNILSKHWLEENHPEVLVELLDMQEENTKEDPRETWSFHAYEIAPGTEDIDPRLLDWRTVMAESSAIKALSKHLPAEEWLKMSAWIYNQLRFEMRHRVVEHPQPDTLLLPESPHQWPEDEIDPRHWEVNRFHRYLIAKHALRHQQITVKTAALLCGIREELAAYILNEWASTERYWGVGTENLKMYSTRRGPVYAFREPDEEE